MADVPVLKFSEAEAVGEDLRDRWERSSGERPPQSLRWPDLVQLVLRRARDQVAQREA